MTSGRISAAGAYAQAERLVATIPVRAIDPTRQRFQVRDQVDADHAPVQSRPQADAADADGASSNRAEDQAAAGGQGRGGFGLLGAFTSFLARMFAQPEAGQGAAVSARDGIQAYARAAGTAIAGDFGATEILSPSFPRLSSGRAVDLTV